MMNWLEIPRIRAIDWNGMSATRASGLTMPREDVSESADQQCETSLRTQKPRYLSAKAPAECTHFSLISLSGSGKLNGANCRFIGRHSPVGTSMFSGKRVKGGVSS